MKSIIFLTGGPGVGKSSIANSLTCDVLHLDDIGRRVANLWIVDDDILSKNITRWLDCGDPGELIIEGVCDNVISLIGSIIEKFSADIDIAIVYVWATVSPEAKIMQYRHYQPQLDVDTLMDLSRCSNHVTLFHNSQMDNVAVVDRNPYDYGTFSSLSEFLRYYQHVWPRWA